MPTIQARKGKDGTVTYRALVRIKGHPVETATFDRKTDAKDWAQKTEAAVKEGRYLPKKEARRRTFGEMIDRYIKDVLPKKAQNSRHSQEPQLLWWKERFGEYFLANVSPSMIAEARDDLAQAKTRFGRSMSSSTIVRYMAALSHCYTVAMQEWEWIEDSPMRRVRKPREEQGRVRFLSDEERSRLLSACRQSQNPFLYNIVVLALSTGMRKSEILGLKWEDIDFGRNLITLAHTKNGEVRYVPVVGHALEVLQEQSRIRRIDNPYVFPAPFRAGAKPSPIDIESAWRVALVKSGLRAKKAPKERRRKKNLPVADALPKTEEKPQSVSIGQPFRFHDLRHSCASYLAMNGATMAEIAEVLGHKTLQMTKRYTHLQKEHSIRVVASMNARIFAEPVKDENAAS